MTIRAVHVGALGLRYWGARRGRLFALRPEPVESDVGDFDELTSALIDELKLRFGESEVTAPLRGAKLGAQMTPLAALRSATRDDRKLVFASVRFGTPDMAMIFAADGRPILWLFLDGTVEASWMEIVDRAAGRWPRTPLALAWETLVPARPILTTELPRVGLHRGDSASWTEDGSRTLSFAAGLGVTPPEVYLPPESEWRTSTPKWAVALRSAVLQDFQQSGVRVVEISGAMVIEG